MLKFVVLVDKFDLLVDDLFIVLFEGGWCSDLDGKFEVDYCFLC